MKDAIKFAWTMMAFGFTFGAGFNVAGKLMKLIEDDVDYRRKKYEKE